MEQAVGFDRKAWLSPVTDDWNDTVHFEYLAEEWREKRGLELV